jgi:hypothetical protein
MATLNSLPSIFGTSMITYNGPEAVNTVIVPQTPLRNGDSVGALIDRIVVSSRTVGAGPFAIEMAWRDNPITSGFVRVGAVAWPQNRAGEANVSVVRLARPMYLPPGDFLNTRIRSEGALGTTYQLNISVIGRQAEEPAERWLPYLTDFVGASYAVGAAISDQSTPADLSNPFDTPLFIDRLVGRVLIFGDSVDPEPTSAWAAYNVRISDHLDNYWVPTPTPFPLVFNTVDRSWPISHEMDPKGFLRVEFEGVAPAPSAGPTTRAMVGLVGSRRIA